MSWAESLFRLIALGSIAANLWQWIRSERPRKRGATRVDHTCVRFPDWRVHAPQWTRRRGL